LFDPADLHDHLAAMLSILRKARLKDKEMRILMLCVGHWEPAVTETLHLD
jgi:hypothetical protein